MRDHALFDKIDLHLIRVLHTVLTERSVSKAAIRLGMHQPAVSASLKRLRDFLKNAMEPFRFFTWLNMFAPRWSFTMRLDAC